MDYGNPILRCCCLDVWPKQKNYLFSFAQSGLLKRFGWLSEHSRLDKPFARAARRLVGGFLYALKIEVNTACTLHCKMCYVPRRSIELPRVIIEALFEQLSGAGVRIEFLGGEPLLRRDLVELVRGARERAGAPFVSLYTSALHATPQLSARLGEAGLNAALVSLISHRREVHDAFTGLHGSWDMTLAGLRHFQAAGVEVYTFTAVHTENYRDVRGIDAFVRQELGGHPLFYQYVPQRRNDPLMLGAEAWHEIKHWVLMEANREHMEFVRRFCLLTGNVCSGGNFVLTVKADGTVQPCPFVSDVPLGSVSAQDIWTIYRNRFHAERFLEFKRLPAACAPCAYRSVCGGGCRASARTLFGAYDVVDHRCRGPYSGPLAKTELMDYVPTFF
jgi:PqqA peptide cyclase